jgi:hypothetical protein
MALPVDVNDSTVEIGGNRTVITREMGSGHREAQRKAKGPDECGGRV